MKIYNSFEEIDRDLHVLKLQMNIEKEEMNIRFSEIKEDLSPISMVGNFIGAVAKKAVLFRTVASVFNWGRR